MKPPGLSRGGGWGREIKFLVSVFFPTSLLAFILVLIAACNGLLCLSTEARPRSALLQQHPKPAPMAAKEEPLRPPRLRKAALRRLLRPSERSRSFAARAREFFNWPCERRFFMTWISKPDSFAERELITMESLFRSHPSACLLVLSAAMDGPRGEALLRPFESKGFRVAAMSPDYRFLLRDTPAALWLDRLLRGKVNPGEVPLGQNLSNLLRLAVLYKFGGAYLDADVVVLRSFSPLRNAIGAQAADLATGNWSRLNNAVMIFDEGHPLLFKFIQEFALTFDGSKWGHNGPYLVSRVSARLRDRPGFNFTVLPPAAFYPVDWSRIGPLFRDPSSAEEWRRLAAKLAAIRRGSFAIHLWNRHSRSMPIERGSVIAQLIADHRVLFNRSSS
ncbi:uncharacterized protein LOC144699949 [Wolffia australiana]